MYSDRTRHIITKLGQVIPRCACTREVYGTVVCLCVDCSSINKVQVKFLVIGF